MSQLKTIGFGWRSRVGGGGKTRAGSEWIREKARDTSQGRLRMGIVAKTAADVRDTVVEGLALDINTKVATPTGFVLLKDITVGQEVIGGNGLPCTVTEVFPTLLKRKCYAMNISGEVIVADKDHRWVTTTHLERDYEGRNKLGKIYEQVRTTDEIRNTLKYEGKINNHSIRISTYVGKHDDTLPIPPYTLGMWLGDGAAKCNTITSHDDDSPFVRSFIEDEGLETTALKTKYTFSVKTLTTKIKDAGVYRNKHIPEQYFHASIEQRTELLRGLLDSDGTISKRGQIEFDQVDYDLICQVRRLVSSLGIKVGSVKHRKGARFVSPSGKEYTSKDAYRITFTTSKELFKLPRKKERTKKYRKEEKWRYVSAVEEVPTTPVKCISVDSPDNTFLVTESYIRTHNSGILAIHPPSERPTYEPSKRLLTWPNGNECLLFSSESPDQLRGPSLHFLWGDEFAAWSTVPDSSGLTAFDNAMFATREGRNPQIMLTTTPKKVVSVKKLLADSEDPSKRIIITRGTTADNSSNLDKSYIDDMYGKYAGTKLMQQELEGILLDDVDGVLWDQENLDANRVYGLPSGSIPPLRVVGVDPSVSDSRADEAGIVVCGSTTEYELYKRQAWVLEDATVQGPPEVWANAAVNAARRWGAPIVIEKNQGGGLLRGAIHNIDPTVPVFQVWAKQGKYLRAEPISMIYQQGRVHHVGYFPDLESQMITWTQEDRRSPDRIDALVHALTALLVTPPQGFSGGRIKARSVARRSLPPIKPTANRRGAIFGAGIKTR